MEKQFRCLIDVNGNSVTEPWDNEWINSCIEKGRLNVLYLDGIERMTGSLFNLIVSGIKYDYNKETWLDFEGDIYIEVYNNDREEWEVDGEWMYIGVK